MEYYSKVLLEHLVPQPLDNCLFCIPSSGVTRWRWVLFWGVIARQWEVFRINGTFTRAEEQSKMAPNGMAASETENVRQYVKIYGKIPTQLVNYQLDPAEKWWHDKKLGCLYFNCCDFPQLLTTESSVYHKDRFNTGIRITPWISGITLWFWGIESDSRRVSISHVSDRFVPMNVYISEQAKVVLVENIAYHQVITLGTEDLTREEDAIWRGKLILKQVCSQNETVAQWKDGRVMW